MRNASLSVPIVETWIHTAPLLQRIRVAWALLCGRRTVYVIGPIRVQGFRRIEGVAL